MSDFPTQARVVIIGGGIVGVSALYHLARAGWHDCVLLEKNELTAGSTWHAAGNVPTFAASWAVLNMQRYSAELYRGLGALVDYPMNYHVSGSIRLAHGKARMQEFEHVAAMAQAQGLQMQICDTEELRQHHPFMETHDLAGGLWDPLDGDIDPSQVTQALAKGARDLGARVQRFTPATGVTRENGEWRVQTDKGEIRCEKIVNAAGYYAQQVGEWFRPFGGRRVPAVVLSHQYLMTEDIDELADWSRQEGRKLPILRDVDTSYYLRQDKAGLNLGPYERNCRVHWVSGDDPLPEDFSFQLFPDDLDRLEFYIEDAMARVPILASAGIGRVINGPIPYAPDGLPLLGPMPGVANAYEAHSFTFGIAQGGGAGKVLPEWVIHGETEWDMWSCDPRRFTGYASHDYTLAKARETYGHEYAIHFPHHEWPEGRNMKCSPLHDRIVGLGGQMGPYNGWERANWFAKEGDDTSEAASQTWERAGPWQQRVRGEVEAVRDSVGVLDLPGFPRFLLSGQGAADWLLTRIAGGLPAIGRMTLGYFPDSRGKCLSEMSILRHSEDEFTLISAAVAQWHDFELLQRALPTDGQLSLTDGTEDLSTLIVTGPQARKLLGGLCEKADLELPWLSLQQARVRGCEVLLARVSFAGELGWEIHADPADCAGLYDAILDAGAVPFGMYALDSMRLEKGCRTWKGDLSTDCSLLEAGLDQFVRLTKPQDFPGKSALAAEQQRGPKQVVVSLRLEGNDQDPRPMAPVRMDGTVVGAVTSSGYGYRVGASIALAMVSPQAAAPGTQLSVEVFGQLCSATVQPQLACWDPENTRIRA